VMLQVWMCLLNVRRGSSVRSLCFKYGSSNRLGR
jgi:hypothetical protein